MYAIKFLRYILFFFIFFLKKDFLAKRYYFKPLSFKIIYFLKKLKLTYLSGWVSVAFFKILKKILKKPNTAGGQKQHLNQFNYAYRSHNFSNHKKSNTYLYGFKSLISFFKYFFPSIVALIIIFYFLFFLKTLVIGKVIFSYFCVTMLYYWLISGFVFFIKKYRFGKYTSAIQRFWKRSYAIFWLIEGFLFLIFIYLLFNSNAEPKYMYDNISVYKHHLISWRTFLFKITPYLLLVICSYFLLLNLKWGVYTQINLMLIFISTILLYILWIEFYQFYYLISYYKNFVWSYNAEERVWILDVDARRTRIANHYLMMCYIAKFWHFMFILIFWFFMVLRASELRRVRYPLFSANFQNMLILYIMSWIPMYVWVKFVLKRFFTNPYYWFFVNNKNIFTRGFFYEIRLLSYSLLNRIFSIKLKFKVWMPMNWSSYIHADRSDILKLKLTLI